MTTDRPLSEWQADLAAYQTRTKKVIRCMKNDAAHIRLHNAKNHKRLFRKRVKQLYSEYVQLPFPYPPLRGCHMLL